VTSPTGPKALISQSKPLTIQGWNSLWSHYGAGWKDSTAPPHAPAPKSTRCARDLKYRTCPLGLSTGQSTVGAQDLYNCTSHLAFRNSSLLPLFHSFFPITQLVIHSSTVPGGVNSLSDFLHIRPFLTCTAYYPTPAVVVSKPAVTSNITTAFSAE
jgi:hypothetical protein